MNNKEETPGVNKGKNNQMNYFNNFNVQFSLQK